MMELTRKQKFTKYIIYAIIILGADLLQNVRGLFPEIFGARCFLLLPVAIILSMGEDELAAAFIGLFSGLLWDLTGAVHLGFNCIYICVFCFLSAAFVSYIARDTMITNVLSSTITIIIYCLLYWLFFIVIKGVENGQSTIFSFYIPCAIYTSIISPIVWLALKPIKRKMKFEKSKSK